MRCHRLLFNRDDSRVVDIYESDKIRSSIVHTDAQVECALCVVHLRCTGCNEMIHTNC